MKQNFSEKELLELVEAFSLKIKDELSLFFRKESVGNIRADISFTNKLKKECGIYYFVQNNAIKYVGRALPSVGLRSRILNQINAFGDVKWDTVIKETNTEVGVIIFNNPEQWYFISALEHYLIEKLERPIFNKRG